MSEQAEPIESEATEIAVVEPSSAPNLFRTSDPATVLRRAQETAEALMPVVRQKGLIADISGKDHLTVEAWQTLGAMLGVTPVCVWTRELDKDSQTGAGWEAKVEARTLDGRVIGAAEAMTLRSEDQWADSDDFALRSMAQTRATSKALASVLRFVATLGGASGTPAEEVSGRGGGQRKLKGEASKAQKSAITKILNKAGLAKDFQRRVVHALAGDPVSKQGASEILDIIAKKDEGPELDEAVETLVQKAIAEGNLQPPSDVPGDDEGLASSEAAEADGEPSSADDWADEKIADG